MPEVGGGRGYRDELAAAYERIRQLEARNRDLEAAARETTIDRGRDDGSAALEHVRDLDATLQRWDRVRASLAMLLGFTGLFALRIADQWSERIALLATCTAMVAVGIILAWPKMVRAQVDPKPHALDVTAWRNARRSRRVSSALDDGARRLRVVAVESDGPTRGDEVPASDVVAVSARDSAKDR